MRVFGVQRNRRPETAPQRTIRPSTRGRNHCASSYSILPSGATWNQTRPTVLRDFPSAVKSDLITRPWRTCVGINGDTFAVATDTSLSGSLQCRGVARCGRIAGGKDRAGGLIEEDHHRVSDGLRRRSDLVTPAPSSARTCSGTSLLTVRLPANRNAAARSGLGSNEFW